ncbi:MAG: biotin/lipoyl-containing protein, partial [Aurantimicrobium sp.]
AGHVAAPFAGVVTVKVEAGQTVAAGDPVASIEAMKMEAAITATITGRVERVSFQKSQQVEAGDLIVVITPITPAN